METQAERLKFEGMQADNAVAVVAHRLAVMFTQEKQLPACYRRLAGSSQQRKREGKDSNLLKKFKERVAAWETLIKTMLSKLDSVQAWRFINLNPKVDMQISRVVDSADFCAFNAYLILRRDTENCSDGEVGNLAQLLTAFQRKVEEHIKA